jgi:bifunctional oligoribonuclease and PAP phosphatase NrnA
VGVIRPMRAGGYLGRDFQGNKVTIGTKAINAIRQAKSVAVAAHINPDGDTIGSLLSLGLGLGRLGKKVELISYDGVPKKYVGLPGSAGIKKNLSKKVDLAITVDCNSPEMVGPPLEAFRKKAGMILAVDHHQIREPFEDIAVIDPRAAAVGEMVYYILKKLNVAIDREIAMNILTSLIVETNSFRFPNVKASTFDICAKVMRTGVEYSKLVDTVFWANERETAVLSGIFMARCKFLCKGRLAWTSARLSDFRKVGGKDEDVDALPDVIRSIKGVDIAVFFREKSAQKLRVSLRSKKNINIAKLAQEYGGGGHSDVAGCSIKNSPRTISEFIARARKYL